MNVRSFPSLHPAQFYLCGYIVVKSVYSRIPLIRINRGEEPSGYTENPDNWIFL